VDSKDLTVTTVKGQKDKPLVQKETKLFWKERGWGGHAMIGQRKEHTGNPRDT